jgi:hypothetical protein
VLSKRLGYCRILITQDVYVHIDERQDREAANLAARAILGVNPQRISPLEAASAVAIPEDAAADAGRGICVLQGIHNSVPCRCQRADRVVFVGLKK